jgi:aspartate ammonia-lyase
MTTRTEKDFLGEMELPVDALYGIHSLRAKTNFPDQTPFHPEWYKTVGTVKHACYITYKRFKQELISKFADTEIPLALMDDQKIDALITAATEVSGGKHFEHFIVPAVQGGAGTSINMNVNEIIANAGLKHLGKEPGNYDLLDPVEDANIYQSTNDVIPTALKITLMNMLGSLESNINDLRNGIEGLEGKYRNTLRLAYTQLQQAVPSSYGRLFSAYSEAFSRDWWRISKCFERLKLVNLGGGAAGTGLGIPTFFIMESIKELQKLTGLPLTRSENMVDVTSNQDALVEVHAVLKSLAVNLEKMVSDLRLLGADISGDQGTKIPARQAGSSIMPGKVNPVIPEFVISAVHRIYANDQLISSLAGMGSLDLNAYIPQIGHAMIESIKLLQASCKTTSENLINGLIIEEDQATKIVYRSPSICTALNPYIGYHKATKLAQRMKEGGEDIFQANAVLKCLPGEKIKEILSPEKLLKLGFSVKDLL